jgi:hypothetical protein
MTERISPWRPWCRLWQRRWSLYYWKVGKPLCEPWLATRNAQRPADTGRVVEGRR